MDQLVLDVFPNDPGHLVAVHFDHRIGDFDFIHSELDLSARNGSNDGNRASVNKAPAEPAASL
jgi:hypothetical protein